MGPLIDFSRRRLQIDTVDYYIIHPLLPSDPATSGTRGGQVIYDSGVLERLVRHGQSRYRKGRARTGLCEPWVSIGPLFASDSYRYSS